MLSSLEIKNIKFSKAMGGYKQEEVDVLLDKVEADYLQFERVIKELQAKLEALEAENEEFKNSKNSIQNVLLSAQGLADKIVNEAKEKSEEIIRNAETSISEITNREKELSATFEYKAQERKAQVEAELNEMVAAAEAKAAAIMKGAEDSVARQQMLFDKLKIEIAAFKTGITAKYKEHLSLLNVIPDTVPLTPEEMSAAITAEFDKAPKAASFIEKEEDVALPVEEDAVFERENAAFEEVLNGFSVDTPEATDEEINEF